MTRHTSTAKPVSAPQTAPKPAVPARKFPSKPDGFIQEFLAFFGLW